VKPARRRKKERLKRKVKPARRQKRRREVTMISARLYFLSSYYKDVPHSVFVFFLRLCVLPRHFPS
jgi:hypothetical protein